MEKQFSFTSILSWLKSTEMFARPSRQISGRWQLVEYYIETENQLRNITENQLKADEEFWNIEFTPEKSYSKNSNLPLPLISGLKNGNWDVSKNYITLNSSGESVEFQFAIEKEILRMLKKDNLGRITFFGFFRKKE
ncbi:MAG: hypothetical protein FD181_316 [Prolixibacteraceae bacterium]|nr:MAG: hypothetical protein FD181_316 [Prolixibacteraceae bacterium]